MKLKAFALAAVASGALTGVAEAQTATTTTTFDFTGTCASTEPCTSGSGKLLVTGYTPGTALTSNSNFVSFTYTSDYLGTVVVGQPVTNFNANFTALPGYDNVSFSGKSYTTLQTPSATSGLTQDAISLPFGNTYSFGSDTAGAWSFSENGAFLDQGTNGTWSLEGAAVSAAPEPGTWALMAAGVGIAGLAMRARRRRGLPLAA